MILTREEKTERAALIAEIADMAAQLSRLRKRKRQIELNGYQRANRARKQAKGE